MKIKVSNLVSANGNVIANQFNISYQVDGKHVEIFQSYKTTIAKKINGVTTLDGNALEYSNTTLKYLKIWLGTSVSKKELYKRIESGEYLVDDLNK